MPWRMPLRVEPTNTSPSCRCSRQLGLEFRLLLQLVLLLLPEALLPLQNRSLNADSELTP